jgi:hypothetical protein
MSDSVTADRYIRVALIGVSATILTGLALLFSCEMSAQTSTSERNTRGSQTPAPALYFPPHVFDPVRPERGDAIAEWFAGYLRKMDEPSLYADEGQKALRCFRFIRISPLGTEVVVRLSVAVDGAKLTAKVARGDGTLLLERHSDVDSAELEHLAQLLQDSRFWSLPSAEPPEQPQMMDGEIWLIEAVDTKPYHGVFRNNPKPSRYTEIGRFLAKSLAKVDDSIIKVPEYTGRGVSLPTSK